MSKTAQQSTLSPYRFAMGNGIYSDDAAEVVLMQTFSFGFSSGLYLSVTTGAGAWGSTGNEAPAHNALFPAASSGSQLLYAFYGYIDPDTVDLYLGANATIATGHGGQLEFVIGGGTKTLTFGAGTTDEDDTLATSSTGTGWQLFKITLIHSTGGSSTANSVNRILVEDDPQTTATSIRDPEL